ncbi:class I SAM-dependent methyltransferase [Planktothrix sp. FACHB-1365]|uniref:class I SAM-dependent methyltransferase n=1 Tax=Planktothrix sp. FACHB-1365 TaxID=2692855 RepID=UPI001682F3FB|nr:class I SAM-dependent methyltransferase [Planktothrix sp. FACHB-1365]MBD2485673.1 class I SAM-dependent methyltransferase [Planktothrix sp. FACHB-1365]
MTDPLTKLTYQAFQQGKSYFSVAHSTLTHQLLNWINPISPERKTEPLSPEILLKIRQLLNEILETDWKDAEKGVYPVSILFDNPWEDFFRYYPSILLELPERRERANQKQHQDFSANIDIEGYPSYYVQNFHHQTDGYLSEMSANLYDLQVEILFYGGADAMRRRVLAPLKTGLNRFNDIPEKQIRVLDVACGTGRTLKNIRAMLPKASLFGVDLSPAYLRKANQLLSEIPQELPQLIQANAEELPFCDDFFHGVTSVFLFHELPANVRQKVINECWRVIKPGGIFIICDSMQISDYPDLTPLMENFPKTLHEPYYNHYIRDDLVERLEKAGFQNITTQNHFASKYWIAHKSV